VVTVQLDCPQFCPALSLRKHIDDANIVQVMMRTLKLAASLSTRSHATQNPQRKLPVSKMLAVFKHMISAVALLHEKGYIHTDITSKSFRYFPESPAKASLYAENPANSCGVIKLSGMQNVITFAKTQGRKIINNDYAIPARFCSALSGGPKVTQEQAVTLCM
jgi:hypothetical protein